MGRGLRGRVRPPGRLPHIARENEAVTLEYARFEELPCVRCRLTGRSVYPSLEACERYLPENMGAGMTEGYERLEELLTEVLGGQAG